MVSLYPLSLYAPSLKAEITFDAQFKLKIFKFYICSKLSQAPHKSRLWFRSKTDGHTVNYVTDDEKTLEEVGIQDGDAVGVDSNNAPVDKGTETKWVVKPAGAHDEDSDDDIPHASGGHFGIMPSNLGIGRDMAQLSLGNRYPNYQPTRLKSTQEEEEEELQRAIQASLEEQQKSYAGT